MADDQFQASANWWDNSTRNVRFESGESQSSSSGLTNIENFVVFHDTQNQKQQLQPPDSATSSSDPNLHMMMGLGLSSSQPMDWNQASLLRGEKGGAAESSSYRSMLQENLSSTSTNFQQEITGIGLSQQVQWRSEKLFSAAESSSTSTNDEFKQVNNNRGFSLDQTQTQFSPQYNTSVDNSTMDSSALYGSPSSLLQGLFGPDNNNNQPPQQASFENRPMNFPYSSSFGLNSNNELMPSNWSKAPQFLRASPPKQLPTNNQLHFTNNAPFWNASEAAAIKDAARSTCSFFPSLQPPFPTPTFDVQSKNVSEVRDSGIAVVKKSGSEREPTSKRPRNETPSPLPPFKVRKEKMGDRITALQQLVSPFGKTDTASVLSEAIEYIKFLHEQVTVLSTPYMKNGTPIQHQQSSSSGKAQEGEVPKQDLRSRGLCLVPVSSTFPVTHEPTVDFWTPTFGGTYR